MAITVDRNIFLDSVGKKKAYNNNNEVFLENSSSSRFIVPGSAVPVDASSPSNALERCF
jgi:hypothetical protein